MKREEHYQQKEDLREWLTERRREAMQEYLNSFKEEDGEERDIPSEWGGSHCRG